MPDPLVESAIHGVHIFRLDAHRDERGRFQETFRRSWIEDAPPMVQSSLSYSRRGVLRGIHFHMRQADYWTIARGHCRVVLIDLRKDSPTFRAVQLFEMSDGEPAGVFIPPLVAHGLLALEDMTLSYLVSTEYDAADPDELGIAWDDPQLGIAWGTDEPILSERDRGNPSLAQVLDELSGG